MTFTESAVFGDELGNGHRIQVLCFEPQRQVHYFCLIFDFRNSFRVDVKCERS